MGGILDYELDFLSSRFSFTLGFWRTFSFLCLKSRALTVELFAKLTLRSWHSPRLIFLFCNFSDLGVVAYICVTLFSKFLGLQNGALANEAVLTPAR